MTSMNQFGLSRNIPNNIKREVRQKCGFGCVVCGSAIYQYHHFDPPFREAKEHNPNGITLLCGKCHDFFTKSIWSDNKLKHYNNNPKSLDRGFSFGLFDIGHTPPTIKFGPNTFINTSEIINIYGIPILEIDPSEVQSGPFRISGLFYNDIGEKIFQIEENEWKGLINNWDIEQTGNSLIIRRDQRKIALEIITNPQKELIVSKINMVFQDVKLQGNINNDFIIEISSVKQIITSGIIFKNARCGICIEENGIIFGKS